MILLTAPEVQEKRVIVLRYFGIDVGDVFPMGQARIQKGHSYGVRFRPLNTEDISWGRCMYKGCPDGRCGRSSFMKSGDTIFEAAFCETHTKMYHGKELFDPFPWR